MQPSSSPPDPVVPPPSGELKSPAPVDAGSLVTAPERITLLPAGRIVSHRWEIITLLMGITALGHFNRVGISVAGGEIFIPNLGISETSMGWVYTGFLITYTLAMLPGGWLIDRIGSTRALTLLCFSMGTLVAITGPLGWLMGTAESLWLTLMILRGLTGICSSVLHPGAAHVVSEIVPAKSRATANGMVTAGALIGIAGCYPLFGGLMDEIGWPLAFLVSGLMLTVYGLVWHQATRSLVTQEDAPAPGDQVVSSTPSVVAPPAGNSVLVLLTNGQLWLVALSYGAYGYFQYLFFYWMSYYFENVLKVTKIEARAATFWIMLGMGLGMAIGGWGADLFCRWLGTARGRRAIVMIGMGGATVFALAGVNLTTLQGVAWCLGISMGFLGMCEGVFWTTATDVGGKSRGFAGAFINTIGNVGGFISPTLTPYLAKSLGWPGAMTVACLICGAGGAMWFLIQFPEKQAEQ